MTLAQATMLALQASILTTVFTFGLQATLHDLLYVTRRPSLLARSLFAMLVIMPIVVVAMAQVFDLSRPARLALVALAFSPIPPILPGREEKAGGHANYALGLMAIAGVLSILTMPLSIYLLGHYMDRPIVTPAIAIAKIMMMSIVVPLALGLGVRAAWPAVARRLAKPAGLIAKVLLAIGAVGLLIGADRPDARAGWEWHRRRHGSGRARGPCRGPPSGRARGRHRLVLALSTASRHPAIALAVAKANFPDEPIPPRRRSALRDRRGAGRDSLSDMAKAAGDRVITGCRRWPPRPSRPPTRPASDPAVWRVEWLVARGGDHLRQELGMTTAGARAILGCLMAAGLTASAIVRHRRRPVPPTRRPSQAGR